jgi:hypothetical protein
VVRASRVSRVGGRAATVREGGSLRLMTGGSRVL